MKYQHNQILFSSEPLESSTPKGGHVSRSIERKVYQEQKYGSVGRQSPARELKYDHSYNNRQEASPLRQRKEIYKYESKTTRSTSGMSINLNKYIRSLYIIILYKVKPLTLNITSS